MGQGSHQTVMPVGSQTRGRRYWVDVSKTARKSKEGSANALGSSGAKGGCQKRRAADGKCGLSANPKQFQNSIVDLQSVMLCKVRGRYNAFSYHHSFHALSVTAACLDLSLQNHSHFFLRLLFPNSKRKHVSETTRTSKEKENHSLFRKTSSRAHTDCPEPWQVLGKL